MFDVFELYVPALSANAELRAVQRETAWGVADETVFHWKDVPFARSLRTVREGSPRVVGLNLAGEANESAETESSWARYLEGLRTVLDAHEDWVLAIETDCDQHPVETIALTSSEVVERLATRKSPLAMKVRRRMLGPRQ